MTHLEYSVMLFYRIVSMMQYFAAQLTKHIDTIIGCVVKSLCPNVNIKLFPLML